MQYLLLLLREKGRRVREGGGGRRERIKPPNNKCVARRFSPQTLWDVRVVKYVQK